MKHSRNLQDWEKSLKSRLTSADQKARTIEAAGLSSSFVRKVLPDSLCEKQLHIWSWKLREVQKVGCFLVKKAKSFLSFVCIGHYILVYNRRSGAVYRLPGGVM